MDSLTDLYNQQIVPLDEELEKQAAEMWKQAEEEDAAGRIMARGFADELSKLAAPNLTGGVLKMGPGGNMSVAGQKPSSGPSARMANWPTAKVTEPPKQSGDTGSSGAYLGDKVSRTQAIPTKTKQPKSVSFNRGMSGKQTATGGYGS